MTKHLSIAHLTKTALADFWRWRWKLVGLTAIIAVPLAVLSNLGLSQDPAFNVYSAFLSMIMNIALIWMVAQLKSGKHVSIRDAYYRGTGSLVRFILVLFVLTMMVVPFLLGYSVYVAGVTGATLAPTITEKLLLGSIWLILSLPTAWLLTRFFLALYAVVIRDVDPIRALKISNQLVKGKTGQVVGRLLLLGLLSLVILTLPAVVLLAGVKNTAVAITLVAAQALTIVVILPFSSLFLCELFLALDRD